MVIERNAAIIPIIRAIFSEYRHADSNFSSTKPVVKFIMGELRYHRLTQRVLCKAPNEMEHLASTYRHYLQSIRKLIELEQKYQGGERSIEESAHLVGLELPETKQ
ncbi:unnamed protein product [Enterobius vermicularis]|uniref:Protein FMC1 homolog n=1 Tax=Enterobius vermicularis TaxID=51028 RepID=A0A0N4V4W0_ENTVE|nr:unnamed protein product [Enterobius vermicularis]